MAYVGNIITWLITYIIAGIWTSLGMLFALLGMWQTPHDAILGAMTGKLDAVTM